MNRAPAAAALAALLLAAWPASAQYDGWTTDYHPNKSLFTLGYQMSQPLGSFHDYISSASFRGFTFDWRSLFVKDFGAGVRFTWNRYNESTAQTTLTTSTGGTLTAPLFRYADQFAVEAIGTYFFNMGSNSMFNPFLTVGIGGVWSNTYQQSIDVGTSQDGFYFIVSPELGLNIALLRGSTQASLVLSVLYNFTTASFRNVSNAQQISETIGLTFAY
jgi:hypothetical protein